jgi:hypothetical protein
VPERRFDSFEEKGHRAFHELSLVAPAKLNKSAFDFVRNHGTMPHQAGVVADILVYEDVSHGDYAAETASPESLHVYAEMNAFLLQHLQ